MTTGGDIIPNLYSLEPDGAPVEPAVKAAATLIGLLSPQEKPELVSMLNQKNGEIGRTLKYTWRNMVCVWMRSKSPSEMR